MADGNALDKIKEAIEAGKKDAEEKEKNIEKLGKDAKEKKDKLDKELEKPKSERDQNLINELTGELGQITDLLKAAKEGLEALAKGLKELQPVLEKLIQLGEIAAETLLKLLKELLDFIAKLLKTLTDLLKELLKLIKLILTVTIIFPILQKIFDIQIAGSVLTQPLAAQPVEALAAVREREILMLKERGINTLGELATTDLIELQRCGINVENVSRLQEQARTAVRPFANDLLFLIEEFDLSLMNVARRAEADFLLPKYRVRAVRADILSRAAVLQPHVLEQLRVTDIIDIEVPSGFTQDCLPRIAIG